MSIRIEGHEIVFRPRHGRADEIRRALLSAFLCPKCHDILKAYYLTDKALDVADCMPTKSYGDSPFEVVSVLGGQALLSTTHGAYSGCKLEVFWTPSIAYNLKEWLQRHYPGMVCQAPVVGAAQIREGCVSGLVAIRDLMNDSNYMLAFDAEAWVTPWRYGEESYEEFEARTQELEKQKLNQLGVFFDQ